MANLIWDLVMLIGLILPSEVQVRVRVIESDKQKTKLNRIDLGLLKVEK